MLRSPTTTTYLVKDNNCAKTLLSSVKQTFISVDGDLKTLTITNLECLHSIRQQDTSYYFQYQYIVHECLSIDKDSEISKHEPG